MHTLDVDAARSASAHRTGHRLAIERFQRVSKRELPTGSTTGAVDLLIFLHR